MRDIPWTGNCEPVSFGNCSEADAERELRQWRRDQQNRDAGWNAGRWDGLKTRRLSRRFVIHAHSFVCGFAACVALIIAVHLFYAEFGGAR